MTAVNFGGEPVPVWPEAPRYCPTYGMPRYRYLPGVNPHPVHDAEGHSFGHEWTAAYVPPARWRENEAYLYGIDLYHQSYFWESHEVWESVWRLTDREGAEGQFLQGLIQNSAAQLKAHGRVWRGVRNLSRHAFERFRLVEASGQCSASGTYMGIHIPQLMRQMEAHYGRLWGGGRFAEPVLQSLAPRLMLDIDGAN